MVSLRAIWRRATTTRYVRTLEQEVTRLHGEIERQRGEIGRLRAENRALLNSILGIAGVPPIVVAEPDNADPAFQGKLPGPALKHVSSDKEFVAALVAGSSGAEALSASGGATARRPFSPNVQGKAVPAARDGAVPLRRRSWQQINRTLEFESARKKRPQD